MTERKVRLLLNAPLCSPVSLRFGAEQVECSELITAVSLKTSASYIHSLPGPKHRHCLQRMCFLYELRKLSLFSAQPSLSGLDRPPNETGTNYNRQKVIVPSVTYPCPGNMATHPSHSEHHLFKSLRSGRCYGSTFFPQAFTVINSVRNSASVSHIHGACLSLCLYTESFLACAHIQQLHTCKVTRGDASRMEQKRAI